jgi:predicted nucleic acid-binding Zn ribbon protein
MTDPDPEVCEVCGASPIVKVFHPVPIHFKGSGFYSTDYGRGSRKREAAESDGGAPKKEEKKEKKPETKAAADGGS